MIEFMVIALPRSGTTWAANWLTTDTTLCLHDPLYQYHYNELDFIPSKHTLGISCTGLVNFPVWLNNHPARKIILHRPLDEINQSMEEIGLPLLSFSDMIKLEQIDGLHLDWSEMFSNPVRMYEYLLQKKFDPERHKELALIEMQPKFSGLTINKEITRTLIAELRGL